MPKSRRWELVMRTARYGVFTVVGVGIVLAILDVPRWVEWLAVGVALTLAVVAWGCLYMELRALRVERAARIPDLGDIARHFDNRNR